MALPARQLIRWRGWVIGAWAVLALLFVPKAAHVQRVLAVRGMNVEQTESARASQLIRESFPNPIAEYVAIVVHGPVRYTNPRFAAVIDSVSAALSHQPYISQVVSVRSIGESTFVSPDRQTTFLIAALTPASTSDVGRTVVPDLRETVRSTLARLPRADGFDVKVTGNPALDYDVRTISAEDTRRGEERALPLTLAVLVLAFGALVAATLPIIVGVAVLLATTFLPAALAILGRDIDRPKWLARMLAWIHTPQGWERWARSLGHHPWRAILGGGLVAALLTFPLTQIKIGLPARNWFPPDAESGQGLAALREMGASGVIQPLRVVVQLPPDESALSGRRLPGLKALSDSIAKDPRVREVRGVATLRPGMSTLQLAIFYGEPEAVRERYPEFFNAYLSADRRTTLIDVIAADSVSLTGMMDLARHVRQTITRITRLRGIEVVVGGFAASSLDLQENLLARFPGIVAMILGVTAIMLLIAFRSVLVPLQAVVLNCVSVSAAFGITVLVFQHGYGASFFGLEGPTEAIFVVVPVLVFATVFGLSMDYEVFLLTRVKEVFDKTGRNDHATMEGLSTTASTITFAALIMIIVFGSFAFTRVLAVQFIGFGLALAVLLDATLIRMVLVPAIMHIAGRWNWWPGVRAPRRDVEEVT